MSLNPFRDPDGLMSGSARYALLDSASCDKSLNSIPKLEHKGGIIIANEHRRLRELE